MKLRRIENKGELYFVVYLFLFTLLKPITITYRDYSTIILLFVAMLLLILCFFTTSMSIKNIKKCFGIVGSIGFIMGMDILFRHNDMQGEILYNFIIYAFIPLFLLVSVRNYNAVLRFYYILSIIVGLFFCIDPFNGYQWSGDYMQFGFSIMIPAFCGTLIGTLYFEKKKMYVLMFFFLVEMLICANKSAFLTALFLWITAYIGFNYKKGIRWKRVVLVGILVITTFVFRLQIFDFMVEIAKKTNLYSYSLTTIRMLLSGETELVLGGRFEIWENAIQLFDAAPLIGNGTGYMESLSTSTGYAHNIELDVLVSYGIVGMLFYVIILLLSLYKLFITRNYPKRTFMLLLFIVWFIPMQFSLSLWKVSSFWIYWGVCFYFDKYERGNNCESVSRYI